MENYIYALLSGWEQETNSTLKLDLNRDLKQSKRDQ